MPTLAQALRLIAITNRRLYPLEPDSIEGLAQAGISALMLREKDLDDDRLLRLALPLRTACARAGIGFIVNKSVKVARELGADAIHLGFDAPPIVQVREALGPTIRLGVSAHSRADLLRALADGADYATLSPVFATRSKETDRPVLGPQGFADAIAGVPLPVVALGGIHAGNAPRCLKIGAVGVACIGSIFASENPVQAVADLAAAMGGR